MCNILRFLFQYALNNMATIRYVCVCVPVQIQKCFFCYPSNPNFLKFLSKNRFSKIKMFQKLTKISDFLDIIYITSKNELK